MEPEEREERDLPEYLEKLDRFLTGKEQTTLYFELEKKGWSPVDVQNLSDEDTTKALTDLIWALWDFNVYIDDADHLTDRELYIELQDLLDEPTFVTDYAGYQYHWSPVGSGSEEDSLIINRYYSDEESRARYAEEYPDEEMPPMELPPYYRSWLPQRAELDPKAF